MKNTITTLLALVSLATYAQQATSTLKPKEHKNRFSGQHVEITSDNKTIFRENVNIETENLVLKADSAIFDAENETVTAYGTKEYSFNGGKAVIRENANNTIRYKLKDDTIYIE